MTELRELMNSIYDFEKETFKKPTGRLKAKELSLDELDRIKRFVKMIVESNFVTEETLIFLSNRDCNFDDVKVILKQEYNKEMKKSTIQSKLWADKNKFIRFFSLNILRELTDSGTNADRLLDIDETIDDINVKYAPTNRLNRIAISLDKIQGTNAKLGDGEFEDFIRLMAPYTRQQMRFVRDSINPNVVDYCRKLLSSYDLSKQEEEHKKLLMDLLN